MNRTPVLLTCLVFCVLSLAFAGVARPAAAHPELRGFVEPGYGVRYSDDGPIEERNLLNETRIMLENQWYGKSGEVLDLRLLGKREGGAGENDDLEVREASILYPYSRNLEIKAGRQVLSWAPGQYEFVNDNFTKDYRSFFLGRDLEFMKAPSDALRLRWFSDYGDLDLALMPEFAPNRTPRGEVLPLYYDGELKSAEQLQPELGSHPRDLPEATVEDGELHARFSKMHGSWELALYGYRGFEGNPTGFDYDRGDSGQFYHPEKLSAGFSARGPFWGGITWLEASYEDIRDDLAGDTTTLPPDEYNLMVGYEFDPDPDVSYLLQFHWLYQDDAEVLRDQIQNAIEDGQLAGNHPYEERSRYRVQLATERSYFSDRLTLRARGFAGLQVQDWHLRLETDYEWSDAIRFYAGSLHYGADNAASRFGALEDYDFFYSRLRYSF